TVAFANGQPKEANNSQSAAIEIMANPDLSQCQTACFRPVGLAFDTAGHLWMSSDATGEIYVIRKDDGSGVAAFTSNAAVSGPTPGPTPSGSSSKPNSASGVVVSGWLVTVMVGLGMLVYMF